MNAGERMLVVLSCSLVLAATNLARSETKVTQAQQNTSRVYLGFDANDYPGDCGIAGLEKNFHFLRLLAQRAAWRKDEFVDRKTGCFNKEWLWFFVAVQRSIVQGTQAARRSQRFGRAGCGTRRRSGATRRISSQRKRS